LTGDSKASILEIAQRNREEEIVKFTRKCGRMVRIKQREKINKKS
jgi:hypothetical protein